MNEWFSRMDAVLGVIVFQNSLRDYLAAAIVFVLLSGGLSLARVLILSRLKKIAARTSSDLDDFIVELLSQVRWPVFAVIAVYVASSSLVLGETLRSVIRYTLVFVVTIRAILLFQEILRYSVTKVLLKRLGADSPSSQALVNSVLWVLKWVLWVIGLVFILDNLGVNISSLVAGIGIGGIAVAMASQAVLGDAFGALSIYLDKPFEVGDFIIIDDNKGTVEHIGLKTTRIRSLTGEQLVFCNSDLTKSRVKNYKRMQTRRADFKIGVTYQTPLEKIEQIPGIIKGILESAEVRVDRVHFKGFGDFALIFEAVFHVASPDYSIYMDKQQAINLAIIREFNARGIEFAYPTQTVYLQNSSVVPGSTNS